MFLALILLTTATAQAQIVGIPAELKGANEARIEATAIEAVAEYHGCDFATLDIDSIKGKYLILEKEEQDAEFAEYPGELSAFTLRATIKLPAGCKKTGTAVCEIKFNLYDEKAYEVEPSATSCN